MREEGRIEKEEAFCWEENLLRSFEKEKGDIIRRENFLLERRSLETTLDLSLSLRKSLSKENRKGKGGKLFVGKRIYLQVSKRREISLEGKFFARETR